MSRSQFINVFVHLAHGHGGQNWHQRYKNGQLLGINEPFPYGFHRAEEFGCRVIFSVDKAENPVEKLFRLALRLVLGFDFVHAWRNRKGIYDGDVVWTYTESQNLAILLLFLITQPKQRPRLLANIVWLFDRWPKFPAPNRWLFRKLLSRADLLTVNCPESLKAARKIVPHVRSELVLFGIMAEEMIRHRQPAFCHPIRIISLGNDEGRDWLTLIDAVRNLEGHELRIASQKVRPKLVAGAKNIEIVKLKSNSELLRLYEWADVMVLPMKPNIHASGITVVQEAVVRGVPVICSDTGGLKAYFSEAEVKYVTAQDPEAIRRAIREFAKDDEGRWICVKRAQARMGPGGLSSHAYIKRHVELSTELLFGESCCEEGTVR
ncbi:MAG: glycosyltransferase [Verrucomicrobiales bacterium]|nr:glycosyltransferase [Verrucomicrobiales bacterium]